MLTGVSNTVLTADQLDTPVSYEDLAAHRQSGSARPASSCSTTTTDMVAVAAGVSRFLAVESCGQCTPCKLDGLELADKLAKLAGNRANERDLAPDPPAGRHGGRPAPAASSPPSTRSWSAASWPASTARSQAHLDHRPSRWRAVTMTELRDIDDGVARWDERHVRKQPDWTYDEEWSGKVPGRPPGRPPRPRRRRLLAWPPQAAFVPTRAPIAESERRAARSKRRGARRP